MTYVQRVVDAELEARLGSVGAVLIEGAKACGKTATARQQAASEVLLDIDGNARGAVEVDPSLVLDGPTPRLIDEWQIEPKIWDHVRRAVDDRQQPGQFILAGSAVPADEATRHTGAMRFGRLRMRPMSLLELGASSGAISLFDLLEHGQAKAPDPGLAAADVADLIARGGWPGLRSLSTHQILLEVRDYLEQVRRTDIREVDGIRRDPERVGRLLHSLARNVATSASAVALAADTHGADGSIKKHTVADYLSALERLFVVEDQPAWAPHLRSRYILRRAPKRHFVDPSLAVAALQTSPEALLRDLNLLGLLFESLAVRDLRVYAQASDARVLHYRDSDGLEVDAIVQRSDGSWAAFEIKLGGERAVEDAAESLKTFHARIDTTKCGEPAALGVIAGTGYGYVRRDGIQVIPLSALGP